MFKVILSSFIVATVAQQRNIVETAQADPELKALVDAVVAGGLVQTLSGPGPFTVFAPINQAFGALGDNILDYVFNPDNVKALDTVLTYHVVSGAVTSDKIKDGQVIPTVDAGQSVTAHVANGVVTINNARVIKANILCTNGVVHIVDNVLVPGNFNYPKDDIVTTAVSSLLSPPLSLQSRLATSSRLSPTLEDPLQSLHQPMMPLQSYQQVFLPTSWLTHKSSTRSSHTTSLMPVAIVAVDVSMQMRSTTSKRPLP